MRLTQPRNNTDLGGSLLVACGVGTLLGFCVDMLIQPGAEVVKPIDTSLTFSQTNRLVVTHYIIIPTTHFDWSAMTSRYPANVTRTTLRFD